PTVVLLQELRFYWVDASPPAPAVVPKFQGERSVTALVPGGAALKIGSTPASIVIAVGPALELPSVATSITASPLFRSAIVTAGMRLNICWKSGGPPPLRQVPPGAPPPGPIRSPDVPLCPAQLPCPRPLPLPDPAVDPVPAGAVACCPDCAPGAPPFSRSAIICATIGGSLRS